VVGVIGLIVYILFQLGVFNKIGSSPNDPTIDPVSDNPFGDPIVRENPFDPENPTNPTDKDKDPIDLTRRKNEDEKGRPVLFQITDFPVTASTVFSYTEDEIIEVVEYLETLDDKGDIVKTPIVNQNLEEIERVVARFSRWEDGVILDADLTDTREITHQEITDPTVLHAQEGFFTNNGSRVILRYWDDAGKEIKTISGQLLKREEENLCPHTWSRSLRIGDSGNDVEAMQEVVLEIGIPFDTETITPGMFDESTKKLVEIFQRILKHKVDGIVGPETIKELTRQCEYQEKIKEEEKPKDEEEKPPYYTEVKFLADNISTITYREKDEKLFYLVEQNDTAFGYTSNTDGGGEKQVFDSPFTEWRAYYSGGDTVDLITKASYFADGYHYRLDITKNILTRKNNPVNGYFGIPSPEGNYIISNTDISGANSDLVLRKSDGSFRQLNIKGLAEKCVFSYDEKLAYCPSDSTIANNEELPDRWYQNERAFKDTLWEIDLESSEPRRLLSPEYLIPGTSIDMTNLVLAKDGSILIFTDKKTGYLWGYQLR
jgi:peptidoglycan hydrolase-like protein with peptidoglycan-binding domain